MDEERLNQLLSRLAEVGHFTPPSAPMGRDAPFGNSVGESELADLLASGSPAALGRATSPVVPAAESRQLPGVDGGFLKLLEAILAAEEKFAGKRRMDLSDVGTAGDARKFLQQ